MKAGKSRDPPVLINLQSYIINGKKPDAIDMVKKKYLDKNLTHWLEVSILEDQNGISVVYIQAKPIRIQRNLFWKTAFPVA